MSMQVTVCPRATSRRTRRWPIKPVPPMMKMDIFFPPESLWLKYKKSAIDRPPPGTGAWSAALQRRIKALAPA